MVHTVLTIWKPLKDQSLNMQIEALKQAGCVQICEEIASGAKTARPVLDEIMRNLREGDTLVIWKLDRLGRNLAHLIYLTNKLIEKKVGLIRYLVTIAGKVCLTDYINDNFVSCHNHRGIIAN